MAKKRKYPELVLRKSTIICLPDGAKLSITILKENDKKLHSYVQVDRNDGSGVWSTQDVVSMSLASKQDFGLNHKTLVESVNLPKNIVCLYFDLKKRQLFKITPDKSKNSSPGKA